MKQLLFTTFLYGLTAIAEIVGCYLPLLWLQQRAPVWVLVPAALSLVLFVWLLSLHPAASGRVYAAYAGVYMVVGLLWLWGVDRIRPTVWDCAGAALALAGMAVMVLAPRGGS